MQGIAIELHVDCNCINICQNKALPTQFIYYINQNWMLFWMLSRRHVQLYRFFCPQILFFYLSPLLTEVGARDTFMPKKKKNEIQESERKSGNLPLLSEACDDI